MKKEFFIGLAIGAAIGGASGILFAPKSGKELRKNIKNKYDDSKEKMRDQIEKLKKQMKKIAG